jgi:hypothetical protein
MELKCLVDDLQVNVPTYLSDAFDKRAVVEMELALAKACETLSPNLDKHEIRAFVAARIIKRVQQGERTFGGMVNAGLAAISELKAGSEIA